MSKTKASTNEAPRTRSRPAPSDLIGRFEEAVLAMLDHAAEPMTATEIRDALTESLGLEPTVGAFYTTIRRLDEKGLAESALLEPVKVRGGRRRQVFRITAAGREALGAVAKFSARLQDSVGR
jgi:DNA-binding PadR family transcriptional regulator